MIVFRSFKCDCALILVGSSGTEGRWGSRAQPSTGAPGARRVAEVFGVQMSSLKESAPPPQEKKNKLYIYTIYVYVCPVSTGRQANRQTDRQPAGDRYIYIYIHMVHPKKQNRARALKRVEARLNLRFKIQDSQGSSS